MIENTKNHPVFEDYAVTEDGRVYRHSKVVETVKTERWPNGRNLLLKGKWLKLYDHCQGYVMVSLTLEKGLHRNKLVHVLVAETHIPNPLNLPCVNHKDGNKKNNHVDNLEWVTKQENTIHAIDTGLIKLKPPTMFGDKHPRSTLTQEEADSIRSYKGSYSEICKIFGVNKSMVYRIKNNKSYIKSEVIHDNYS